jgi:hypothetical protein
MDYTGGEIDIEGVCFGDLNLEKALQPVLEKIATDTLRIMLRQNPPYLEYNLKGDTAKIEIGTEAFSVGEYMCFTEDLSYAVRTAIDCIAYGGIQDENGWIGDEDKPNIIKMRDDLQKNLDFVNMWLERKPK